MNKLLMFYGIVSIVSAGLFGGTVSAGDVVAADDILDQFRGNIFTVNAYVEKEAREGEDTTGKNRFCKNVGTGFSFGQPGYLATLHCVVENASRIVVTSQSGERFTATYMGTSPAGYVSVLRVDEPFNGEVTEVPIRDAAVPGDEVVILSVDDGVLSPHTGELHPKQPPDGIVVNAIANNATSGAPVFSADGELLGLLAMQVEEGGEGAATVLAADSIPHEHSFVVIPAGYVWGVIQLMVNSREGVCGWLGIEGGDGLDGVMVNKVFPGSPADVLGIEAGDRIVRFNGGETPSFRYLVKYLTDTRAGDSVDLIYLRDGKRTRATGTLAPLPGR